MQLKSNAQKTKSTGVPFLEKINSIHSVKQDLKKSHNPRNLQILTNNHLNKNQTDSPLALTMNLQAKKSLSKMNQSLRKTPNIPNNNNSTASIKFHSRKENRQSKIGRAIMMLNKCLQKISRSNSETNDINQNTILISESLKILESLEKENQSVCTLQRKAKSAFRVNQRPKNKNMGEPIHFNTVRKEEESVQIQDQCDNKLQYSKSCALYWEQKSQKLQNSVKPIKFLSRLRKNDEDRMEICWDIGNNRKMIVNQKDTVNRQNKVKDLTMACQQVNYMIDKGIKTNNQRDSQETLRFLSQRQKEYLRIFHLQEAQINQLRSICFKSQMANPI